MFKLKHKHLEGQEFSYLIFLDPIIVASIAIGVQKCLLNKFLGGQTARTKG